MESAASDSSSLNSPFALQWIPTAVTTLFLDSRPAIPLSKKDIAILPPNLTQLHVGFFEFESLKALKKHFPSCSLHIYESIDFWEKGNGDWIRKRFGAQTEAVFDCDAYVAKISRYLTKKQVNCKFHRTRGYSKNFPPAGDSVTHFIQRGTNAPGYGTVVLDPRILVHCKLLRRLNNLSVLSIDLSGNRLDLPASSIPSSLVELNLGTTEWDQASFMHLPSGVQKVTATGRMVHFETTLAKPLNLLVLDTPNWIIPASLVKKLRLKRCQVLNYKKQE